MKTIRVPVLDIDGGRILDSGIFIKNGDIIGDIKTGIDRVGYVITTGRSREEAVNAAEKYEESIQIKY